MRRTGWLPLALWPVGAAAVATGFMLLLLGDDDVTAGALVLRSVGGSFIACGLIAWQRRPDARTGQLMTLTGFVFLAGQLLAEIDRPLGHTLGEIVATWWYVPFAALVLGFPSGRLASRTDRLLVAGFVLGGVVLQLLWVAAEGELADRIDEFQRALNSSLAIAVAIAAADRWRRAAPPLRRLLLPTLAGAFALAVLGAQGFYRLSTGEFVRNNQEITAVVLFLVPLAYLLGILRAHYARAGMADLVVALQRAPDTKRLGALLAEALGDPSLELVPWPAVAGPGRAVTPIDHDGERVAAIVHDAALSYEQDLLDVVCAAAQVALERERMQAELDSRLAELAGSRARIVEAGDAARRRIERDLHDGAQQRLVSLAIALRMTEDRIRDDPELAASLVAAARKELSESLEELRELARGIHPAVLEHGLEVALESLAARSATPVALTVDLEERLPRPVELAAYFVACEGLTNVGKYAQASRAEVRVRRCDGVAVVEVSDDGIGGAAGALGSGLSGLADRVEALGGSLSVDSPAGSGTVLRAELPCAVRPAAL